MWKEMYQVNMFISIYIRKRDFFLCLQNHVHSKSSINLDSFS